MGGGPRQNIAIPFGTEKTRIVCLPDGKKSADTCNRFDRIPACDRQTDRQMDGQTDGQSTPCHGIVCAYAHASNGKKIYNITPEQINF